MSFDEENKAIRQYGWQDALMQAAYDAFIVCDEENRVLFWSRGAETLYGWSAEEAIGQSLDDLLHTHSLVTLAERIRIPLEEGLWEGELEHTRRDGLPLIVASRRIRLRPPEDSSLPPTILEINRDITELNRTLTHLRFMTEASKLLVSSLDYREVLQRVAQRAVPMIADWCRVDLLDEDGIARPLIITHVDPEKVVWAYELDAKTPYNPDAPTGIPAVLRNKQSDFFPDIPDELLVASAKDEEELALTRSLGFSSVITVPLVVQEQGIGAITLVTTETKRRYTPTDLTMAEELASRASLAIENARIYQQLQAFSANLEKMVAERTASLAQLNAELQRSNQELQEFAYVASHDLQEPLRKIQAFGNLLEDEYGPVLGEGQTYLDRMRNAASRMQILINDLLIFSRVTSKALPFAEVDLTVIAGEVVADLEASVRATHGVIEIKPLPTIEADPLQMRQLLQNLIGNALKFHRQGVSPIVRVSATIETASEEQEALCVLSVEDNGIGFDEKYLDRIFTVFQRLHARGEYEGTGIGLAVVRKIVERHSGTITARSTVGQGATFIVILPVHHTFPKSAIVDTSNTSKEGTLA